MKFLFFIFLIKHFQCSRSTRSPGLLKKGGGGVFPTVLLVFDVKVQIRMEPISQLSLRGEKLEEQKSMRQTLAEIAKYTLKPRDHPFPLPFIVGSSIYTSRDFHLPLSYLAQHSTWLGQQNKTMPYYFETLSYIQILLPRMYYFCGSRQCSIISSQALLYISCGSELSLAQNK